ncbi:MAG: hypothetical protein LW719_07635, partial [Comamonadaceae bacterium]|nr:hypothetical protein [Comamonadaceae bacterium]
MIEVKNPELNPSSNRARPLPWPLALALTAAVSAAHLWFLLAVPLQVGFNDDWLATSAPVLSTRVIEAAGPTPQKNQGQAAQANTQSTPNQIGNAAATGPSPGIAPAAPADAPSNSGAAGVQIAVSQLQEAAQNQSIAPTPPDPAAQAQSSPALPSKDAEPQAPSPA